MACRSGCHKVATTLVAAFYARCSSWRRPKSSDVMPTKPDKTAPRLKKNSKRCPSCAKSDNRNRHVAGLHEVMAALRRELERCGEMLGLHDGADFSWRDIAPMPTESGAYLRREFTGTTAAVIDAAVRVQHTYDILTGPLPLLLQELRGARAAMQSAWVFASERGAKVTALIHNADMTRRARVAFGAEPSDVPAFDFDAANDALLSGIRSADDLDTLIESLEARMPDVITAGFYEPKGTGCVGHFAMLLSENVWRAPTSQNV